MLTKTTITVLAVLTGTSLGPATASATFPGANGPLALQDGGPIELVNPDGSDRRTVVRRGTGPAFSPDGRTLAYVRPTREGNADIFIKPAAGGRADHVVDARSVDFGPAFSADGRRLIFTRLKRMRGPDTTDVMSVRLTGRGLHNLTPGTRSTSEEYPVASPDGTAIYFVGGGTLWRAELDGSAPVALLAINDTGSEVFGDRPYDVSPDGRRLVYVTEPEGGDCCELRLIDANGSNSVQLPTAHTTRPGFPYVSRPLFSPDGSAVVYRAQRRVILPGCGACPVQNEARLHLLSDHSESVLPFGPPRNWGPAS